MKKYLGIIIWQYMIFLTENFKTLPNTDKKMKNIKNMVKFDFKLI